MLAEWIAQCGADAVWLEAGYHFEIFWNTRGALMQTIVGWIGWCPAWQAMHIRCKAEHWISIYHVAQCAADVGDKARTAKYAGEELRNVMRGPCQQLGIRCTDVDGNGGVLLFERM